MKLLFDLQATQSAIMGPGGGGEYARAVFRRLVVLDGQNRIAGFRHPDFELDPEIAELVSAHNVELVPSRNMQELQAVLASGRYSGFMSGLPYNYHALSFEGMDVFLAVHGLRPLEEPMPWDGRHYAKGLPALGKWLAKYVVERVRPDWRLQQFQGLADVPCRKLHLIVPSWHTRYSMIEKLQLPDRASIHQFYCPETAVCQVENPDMKVLDRLGVSEGRYLFMVSGNRWIKNSHRGLTALLKVMENLPADRRLPVVITGGVPGGLPRDHHRLIVPAGNLSLDELAALYRGARAFVYPTLNEGFGYPPLEAFAQGTPVICAAVSSVTEIVGDAGLYLNPTSLDELKIRLRLAVEDDDLLADYARRGRRRLGEVRERQDKDLNTLCSLLLESVPAS